MEFAIGAALALAVAAFATGIGLDRDRAFYPTVLIVVASLYILFAVMGASGQVVIVEMVAAGAFMLAAAIGFKSNMWLVAAALAGHGVFDFVHSRFITNPGVPIWWPGFCGSYDVVAGVVLGVLLMKRSTPSSNSGHRHT